LYKKNRMIVAGHRGYKAKYPENTLLSFEKALDVGVDMIEFDINLTGDQIPIIMHDSTVDRTTNGSGQIRGFSLKKIKELDAGGWFSPQFAGEKVPNLEELLEFVSPHRELLFNVEIKDKSHEAVDLSMGLLDKYDVVARCVFTCFDAAILAYIKKKYGVKCQGFPSFLMQNFENEPGGTYSLMYAAGIDMKYVSKEMVDFFRQWGIHPWPYGMDTREEVLQVADLGVPLVTCDDPGMVLGVLREIGLHD
jgi:glycerophosphoryl diester phosphodiesterase